MGASPAARNMAIDESILYHHSKGISPATLRLYMWKPPAVSIGYFQSMKNEVNIDRCREMGVDYIRRITGGGAVYHDKEVTYSIVMKKDRMPENILESYEKICAGVLEGLRLLGIEAEFAPLNDIIANGKKISGNAQTRKMGCILQHGTIIHDVDVETMFSILNVPDEKIRDKLIKDVRERVTSVNNILGARVPTSEIIQKLAQGFSSALGVDLIRGELSEEEIKYAKELEEKYSSEGWNFKK